MDAISGFAPTLPPLPAIGMILTFLLDVLEGRGGPTLGFIAGISVEGRWSGLTGEDSAGAVMVAIVMIPLLVAAALMLAVVWAVRRPRQRPDVPSPKTSTTTPGSMLASQRGSSRTATRPAPRTQPTIPAQH